MRTIKCDSCQTTIEDYNKLISINHIFRYGSQRDGDSIQIDLCEDCLDKLERNISLVKSFE
jgi:hypothetical protein